MRIKSFKIIFILALFIFIACSKNDDNNDVTTIEFPKEFTQEFKVMNKTAYQTMNEGVIDLSNDASIRIIITLSKLETGTYKINSDNVFNGISPDNAVNEFKATAVLVINERLYYAKSGDIHINNISNNTINGTYELLGYSDDYHNIQIYINEGFINDVPIHTINYEEVIDIEGNIYKSVDIGNQTWMAENLGTTKYNDGSPISHYYSHSNHPTTDPEISNLFYQGKALTVSKNVCPAGWHVPTTEEWNELLDYREEEEYSGALKLKTTTGWGTIKYGNPPEISLNTNSSGMTIEPKGYIRGVDTYWYAKTNWAKFLTSSTKISGKDTNYYHVHINFTSIGANTNESIHVNDGYNIRCIKDK